MDPLTGFVIIFVCAQMTGRLVSSEVIKVWSIQVAVEHKVVDMRPSGKVEAAALQIHFFEARRWACGHCTSDIRGSGGW